MSRRQKNTTERNRRRGHLGSEERRKKAHMAEPNRLGCSNRPISPSPQNHRHCRPNLRLEAWKAKQCDCIS
ncbi:hypothetical protein EYF80_002699 [Liparis tanakae]|uniref:Uncharacterized protein n=1 Tax=Liparis tanakae TaxID=230148 RepID=A0A4Z2JAU0_9TELE|nr:hypothetical protein EYF80_002699 [Liparis tanakae]